MTAKVTWGDTVRVKAEAPPTARPNAIAAVVGMREIENPTQAREFSATIGSRLYLIEFGDGEAIEIPEGWIDSLGSPA